MQKHHNSVNNPNKKPSNLKKIINFYMPFLHNVIPQHHLFIATEQWAINMEINVWAMNQMATQIEYNTTFDRTKGNQQLKNQKLIIKNAEGDKNRANRTSKKKNIIWSILLIWYALLPSFDMLKSSALCTAAMYKNTAQLTCS